jgi:hypothetical protein
VTATPFSSLMRRRLPPPRPRHICAADFVLVPLRPSSFDLATLDQMLARNVDVSAGFAPAFATELSFASTAADQSRKVGVKFRSSLTAPPARK